MILLAGRTWFSSHGPTPVFTDSQQNGTKVMARLGDEVSNSWSTFSLCRLKKTVVGSVAVGIFSYLHSEESI